MKIWTDPDSVGTITDVDDTGRTGSGHEVTVNQVVAWNLARVRKDAGLTQQQLAEKIGWTAASVSEAERSWDGKRTREFSAQDLAVLALALGVPVAAFFLAPGDEEHWFADGTGRRRGMGELMRRLFPDSEDDTDALNAYRARWNARMARYFADDPGIRAFADRWIGDRADRRMWAARLRSDRDHFLDAAERAEALAAQIEPEQEKP